MKTLWTSFKRNKVILLFITIIFLCGVITGFLFYFKQDATIKDSIFLSLTNLFQENVFQYKNIFYHFILLLFLVATLFCFIGVPLLMLYIFVEGISVGFIIPIFFSLFKINAILNFLLYFLLVKLLFLFFLFLLFTKFCRFVSAYISSICRKNYLFMSNLKYIMFLILLILLNDIFIYFVSNPVLTLLLG